MKNLLLNKVTRRLSLISVFLATFVVGLFLNIEVANAHETRDVLNGKYQLRVGFINEPVYQGLENGLFLGVCRGRCTTNPDGNGFSNGVTGVFDTLKAEVVLGGQSMRLASVPVPRQPGRYNAPFVPTRVGDYTYHLFGTIETDNIDEKFTASPTTFDSVQPLTLVQFPDKPGYIGQHSNAATLPDNSPTSAATSANSGSNAITTPAANSSSLPTALQSLQKHVSEQQQQLESAKSSANMASTMAWVGIAVGVIGIGVAVLALVLADAMNPSPAVRWRVVNRVANIPII